MLQCLNVNDTHLPWTLPSPNTGDMGTAPEHRSTWVQTQPYTPWPCTTTVYSPPELCLLCVLSANHVIMIYVRGFCCGCEVPVFRLFNGAVLSWWHMTHFTYRANNKHVMKRQKIILTTEMPYARNMVPEINSLSLSIIRFFLKNYEEKR